MVIYLMHAEPVSVACSQVWHEYWEIIDLCMHLDVLVYFVGKPLASVEIVFISTPVRDDHGCISPKREFVGIPVLHASD